MKSREGILKQVQNNNFDQIFLIDKPVGWTSFDVVAKIRNELRQKSKILNSESEIGSPKKIKVGHAGTLDPFATGLLIVLTGSETKNQDKFMKLDKEYEATIRLGYKSTTGDPEGEINEVPDTNYQVPSENQISTILKNFIGEIEQIPPAYSAIKINGKRAYKLAREGKEVIIEPRKIKIYDLKIINYKWPALKIKVNCSSGTYIRTLGEDIGNELSCGGYLTELKRTKIGGYSIDNAKTIEYFIKENDL